MRYAPQPLAEGLCVGGKNNLVGVILMTILHASQTVPPLPRHLLRCRAAVLIAALPPSARSVAFTAILQGLPSAVRRITRKNRRDGGGKPIEVLISPTFTASKRLRAPAATRPALRSPSVREYAFGSPFGGFAAATPTSS